MSRRTRSKQQRLLQKGQAFLVAGAMSTAVSVQSAPAAAIDPATAVEVIGYIAKAYSFYQENKDMLGAKAPTLAQRLAALKAEVISEIRNQPLRADTMAVFDLFLNLADNRVGDPTNDDLFTHILVYQTQTQAQMADIIRNTNSPASSYELAPAFNSLIATGVAVLKIKGEIFPEDPSSWRDFHRWLLSGIRSDYHMVGSQYHECWDGSNPGWAGPMPAFPAVLTWLAPMSAGKFEDSQLYQRLMDKNINTGTYDWQAYCLASGRYKLFSGTGKTISCNPVTDVCTSVCANARLVSATRTSNQCSSSLNMLECAHSRARQMFGDDPVVEVVREGMTGIMSVSGGNTANTNANHPVRGELVDPRVREPSCSRSYAYPQKP